MSDSIELFPSILQPIVGYHLDEDGDWVAELACGHNQHVRHNPPWNNRPWTVSEAGRVSMIGQQLGCRKCVAGAERDKLLPFEPLVPNAATIDAMKAARAGDTKKFDGLDALMADLHADD